MKIHRSTKCSLKFATQAKRSSLNTILEEYGRVVNSFIDQFWEHCPKKSELLKPIVDSVDSWFSARMRKVAAREAIDMVKSAREKDGDGATKPVHRGKRMCVSSTIASLTDAKSASGFDCWLRLSCIGAGVSLDIPIKLHKHFHALSARGKRLESYVITRYEVTLAFEIETGPKHPPEHCVGVDTGIKSLATLHTGDQIGSDVEAHIDRIRRCKHGSKGQKRAVRALKQRMDEAAKEVCHRATLVVVENLKGIGSHRKKPPKRRLGKNMRRSIGRWNYRYWLETLQRTCEDNRVAFRSVGPRYTSTTCSACGHADRRNRSGEDFQCRQCGHVGNADVNAAWNILGRFLSGPYGAGCKPVTA